MGLRQAVPWWLRIGAKIVLSRLPIPYGLWKRFGLFEHGDMNQPQRALETFITHARTAGVLMDSLADSELARLNVHEDFSVLELGPGDSMFTAVIAKTLGATRSWLVDAGAFATTERNAYVKLVDFLRSKGYPVGSEMIGDLKDLLHHFNSVYLTEGVRSLGQIPDHSVDFCLSNAVLEHIPKQDFSPLASELRRILKPDGVSVHRVDLKDHLGGGLNNLRFSKCNLGEAAIQSIWVLHEQNSFFRHAENFRASRV